MSTNRPKQQTLTFMLMDPPYESERTTTAMRLIGAAAERGHRIRVFAYEGAVFLPLATQQPHANAMHGTSIEEENHPLTRDWVRSLMETAQKQGGELTWINCGLCVDERGAQDAIDGIQRGSPADLSSFIEESDNVVTIPTR